jgi:hypothetical protein
MYTNLEDPEWMLIRNSHNQLGISILAIFVPRFLKPEIPAGCMVPYGVPILGVRRHQLYPAVLQAQDTPHQ